MITIICCYNNKEILNDFLLASLEEQTAEYQLILIDTLKENTISAAQGYNRAIERLSNKTEHLLFLHQDIYLKDPCFLEKTKEYLTNHPNDIIGLTGIKEAGIVLSNLKHKDDESFCVRTQLKDITEVKSLDECCFAINHSLLRKTGFDEYVCNHWHLYAVELCYNARKLHKSRSYVVPLDAYHNYSYTIGLTTNRHFLRSLWRITRKYSSYTQTIYSPCYVISTNFAPALMRIIRTSIKNILR